MQARYEMDSAAHPNRIIVGSETHPREIDKLWNLVTRHPNIIGDFTWVGWNYLGEAGIGRNNYGEAKSLTTSYLGEYPWIGSACGDLDMTGVRNPISFYREIVYGLRKDPFIAVLEPSHYGEPCQESPWGWADAYGGWSWNGYEGKPIQVEIYANADEVVLYQDDTEIGRAPCGLEQRYKARFEMVYRPGCLRAVSIVKGEEIGEQILSTASGAPKIAARASQMQGTSSEDTLIFVEITIEDDTGIVYHCCNPEISLTVKGSGVLLGMGSGNPVTDERYDDATHTTDHGRLLAIVRRTGSGDICVTASADGFVSATTLVSEA